MGREKLLKCINNGKRVIDMNKDKSSTPRRWFLNIVHDSGISLILDITIVLDQYKYVYDIDRAVAYRDW